MPDRELFDVERHGDPFRALGDVDGFLAGAPDTAARPFGGGPARLAASQRVAAREAAAAAAAPKKLTKAEYAAKLEQALRANPEFAELHMDVATRVALGHSNHAAAWEPDEDEGSALADLLAEDGD